MQTYIDFPSPRDPQGPRLRHRFGQPLHQWQADSLDQVRGVLDAVEQAALQGLWCVGWLRYEAAPAFDSALQTHDAEGPLAWFAAFAAPLPGSHDAPPAAAAVQAQWSPALEREAFDAAVHSILAAIAEGQVYQINYTAAMHGVLQGSAQALFAALKQAQPEGYTACLDNGQEQVLSVSPELFFDWDGHSILARPMKGTAPRGATPEDDAQRARQLCSSPKERAENVMIVDLLRNDISRIAEPHSVSVPRLFHAEALPAVWQMTSDVLARTRPGTRLVDVFGALFPCGSITGAPKVQAMRLIKALEPQARGVYCGALGVVRPAAVAGHIHATFNVPIRTVSVRGTAVRCGIGSGITAGSQTAAEWEEWLHKRAFVERASAPFELLETLALQSGVLRHLDAHLERMAKAARHFGFVWQAGAARSLLDELAARHAQGLWRVRLLLAADGVLSAQAYAMQETPSDKPVRLQLAPHALEQAYGEFVRYKTTRRGHYEALAPQDPEVFDSLLWNRMGEITECTRGNIAALIDGRWITPPLACGLLDGVGRAQALREGRLSEAVLHLSDVPQVQAWAFINSLRGWLPAQLVDTQVV